MRKVLPNTCMNDHIKKTASIKKSVSFPPDLWEFVENTAGQYGQNSKVIQEALRQMRERVEKSAQADFEKAAKIIKSSNRGNKK